MEVDEDSSRVWEVFLLGRSDVNDEFRKDDDTVTPLLNLLKIYRFVIRGLPMYFWILKLHT